MSSAVIDKLRGLLRRAPVDEVDLDRPTLDWNPVPRRLDALSREIDRLASQHAQLEARVPVAKTSELGPALPTAEDVARIDAAIASLQSRAAEFATGQTAMASALRRADEEVAQFHADRDEIVRQISAIHASLGRDRSRLDELAGSIRTLRDDLAAASHQFANTNVDWSTRSDDLSRRVVSRLGPLYLVSLLALIASLAAIALVLSKF